MSLLSSSLKTFLAKYILSGTLILLMALIVEIVWVGSPSHSPPAPLAVRIIATPLALLFGLYSVRFSMKIMSVRLDGTSLYLSSYFREIIVPLSNIDDVRNTYSYRRGVVYVCVTFSSPTAFGKEILFLPKSKDVLSTLRASAKVDKVAMSHSDQSTGYRTLGEAMFLGFFLYLMILADKLPLKKLPHPFSDILSYSLGFVLLFLFAVLMVSPGLLFRFFLPTHILESLICVSALLYPFVLPLFVIKVKDKSAITIVPEAKWDIKRLVFQFLMSLYVLLGLVGVVYAANVVLDHSPSTPTIVRIVGKEGWQCWHKHARCVDVMLTTPTPIPFTFTDIEDIELNYRDYNAAEPGHSEVTLFLHQGFLGLPWYEEKRYIFTK